MSANGETNHEITCLIVDDHEVVREGLRLSLSRASHIRVIGEAGDGDETIERVPRSQVDVLLLDIRMPKKSGIDVLRGLAAIDAPKTSRPIWHHRIAPMHIAHDSPDV